MTTVNRDQREDMFMENFPVGPALELNVCVT